ncbi:MAG: bifunctional phosphopantothenoylcysteine decarboxylase/phosphopantothenate--cysteine ligase CoaBC [Armatimonadota bacterium]
MQNIVKSNYNGCSESLKGKKIILGVTGSIAAYKAANIASTLTQKGADVHVVMTENAMKLITPATFWSITHNPVLYDMWNPPNFGEIQHISLPESADLMLIAPASANVIGKLANGLADDLLTTMATAARCPIMIAPAMNHSMYTNPIVVANIDKLRNYERIIIEPETGWLACGESAVGRLASVDKILLTVEEKLIGGPRDFFGKRIIVTAGPTQEPIDPVRFITNRSSGKMGYAIAEAAAKRGGSVLLISGPTDLPAPNDVEVVNVTTVKEMHKAVMDNIRGADLFISAAAPADFTPAEPQDSKIKKTEKLTLELDKALDILSEVGQNKGDTILVGFAAETENIEKYAKDKLNNKNLDLIVANDVSSSSETFGSDTNQVTLISRFGDTIAWPRMSKSEVANSILDYVKTTFMED